MNTLLLPADHPGTAETAAEIIRRGGLVAIPTETVYGLGANGLDEEAVVKIFEAKGRPQDNPLILHICGPEQMEIFCHHIPQKAYDLADAFWPGPLTSVPPAKESVPNRSTGAVRNKVAPWIMDIFSSSVNWCRSCSMYCSISNHLLCCTAAFHSEQTSIHQFHSAGFV